MQLKNLDEAETNFRRALAVHKNHALALVRLGYCKLLSGELQEAHRGLETAAREAILTFQRALQQRCGTVALASLASQGLDLLKCRGSVKGLARIYMALALMGKQESWHQVGLERWRTWKVLYISLPKLGRATGARRSGERLLDFNHLQWNSMDFNGFHGSLKYLEMYLRGVSCLSDGLPGTLTSFAPSARTVS